MAEKPRLVLASASAARRDMLNSAGLTFDIVPAEIDEDGICASMVSESACVEASDIAAVLAAEKAASVSRRCPGAVVVGSDQVLALGARILSKAATVAEAREVLDTLRGRTHELASGVALARDGCVLWQAADRAQLTMRPFSDEFLATYLACAGAALTRSVGCYEIEGIGIQLFERIDGDHFTILGMPLLPLLARLREEGMVTP
jgi:septum formation protein